MFSIRRARTSDEGREAARAYLSALRDIMSRLNAEADEFDAAFDRVQSGRFTSQADTERLADAARRGESLASELRAGHDSLAPVPHIAQGTFTAWSRALEEYVRFTIHRGLMASYWAEHEHPPHDQGLLMRHHHLFARALSAAHRRLQKLERRVATSATAQPATGRGGVFLASASLLCSLIVAILVWPVGYMDVTAVLFLHANVAPVGLALGVAGLARGARVYGWLASVVGAVATSYTALEIGGCCSGPLGYSLLVTALLLALSARAAAVAAGGSIAGEANAEDAWRRPPSAYAKASFAFGIAFAAAVLLVVIPVMRRASSVLGILAVYDESRVEQLLWSVTRSGAGWPLLLLLPGVAFGLKAVAERDGFNGWLALALHALALNAAASLLVL